VNARDTFGEDCRHLIKTAKQNLNQFQGENVLFFDAMKNTLGRSKSLIGKGLLIAFISSPTLESMPQISL